MIATGSHTDNRQQNLAMIPNGSVTVPVLAYLPYDKVSITWLFLQPLVCVFVCVQRLLIAILSPVIKALNRVSS